MSQMKKKYSLSPRQAPLRCLSRPCKTNPEERSQYANVPTARIVEERDIGQQSASPRIEDLTNNKVDGFLETATGAASEDTWSMSADARTEDPPITSMDSHARTKIWKTW